MRIDLLARLMASAAVVAAQVGLMCYFHITTYAYLAYALAGSLVIYLWTRPGWRSIAGTVIAGAFFAALYGILKGGPILGTVPAFLGMGCLASLSLAALWSPAAARRGYLDTCITAAMFPLFLITAGFSLAVTTEAHPKTYDLFLYAFDARLGVQPSFLVGRFLESSHLRQICYFGYEALPLAMAIAFAMERSRRGRRTSSILLAFMVAAADGFLLYNLYPAAGPIHVFGKRFPNAPPLAGPSPFELVALATAPRNAMPSVHIAMALLILWNARWAPRLWRILSALLLGLTVLATLGFGEHYLVDLLVAVPFALAAAGVSAAGLPWRSWQRAASVGGGGAAVLVWLLYLRSPVPPGGSGLLAWVVLLATAVSSVLLESRLHRAAAGLPSAVQVPYSYPRLSPDAPGLEQAG